MFNTNNIFSELQAFTVLEELLLKKEICIAVKEKLTKDSGVAGDSIYDNIVRRLMAKPSARGNVLTKPLNSDVILKIAINYYIYRSEKFFTK